MLAMHQNRTHLPSTHAESKKMNVLLVRFLLSLFFARSAPLSFRLGNDVTDPSGNEVIKKGFRVCFSIGGLTAILLPS